MLWKPFYSLKLIRNISGSCAVNLNREPHLFADHVRAEIIGTEIIANYFAWRKGGGGGWGEDVKARPQMWVWFVS